MYASLLEDVDVRRWYGNVARGSRVTADVYYRLSRFIECKYQNLIYERRNYINNN